MTTFKIRLSKFLSYILRHAPESYNLELDENGYADLDKVLHVLKERFKFFKDEDLTGLIKDDPKGRFEILENRIRTTYGHSIKISPKTESTSPPEILYHGTSPENAKNILENGLKPMQRQFVHLSLNEKDAHMIGLRHAEKPVMLKIMAKEASKNGVKFFKEKHVFFPNIFPKIT